MKNNDHLHLHLIRHAETEWQSNTGKDFDRKITDDGRKHVIRLGQFLNTFHFHDIHCFCSSAMRTRETLDQLSTYVQFNQVSFKDELYLADFLTLFQFVANTPAQSDLLLIGHNNGLSELATYVSGQSIMMGNCEYLKLSFPISDWRYMTKDSGSLTNLFRD